MEIMFVIFIQHLTSLRLNWQKLSKTDDSAGQEMSVSTISTILPVNQDCAFPPTHLLIFVPEAGEMLHAIHLFTG